MRIKAIANIEYHVQDLDRSIDFFTNTLGFYLQRRTHQSGVLADVGDAAERGEHVFVGMGDTWVELMPPPKDVPQDLPYEERKRPNYVFAVEVEDLDEAMSEAAGLGIPVGPVLEHPASFWGRQAVISPGALGQPIALREFRAPDNTRYQEWHADETNADAEQVFARRDRYRSGNSAG
jgi:catechol 2,3-dioxygenase-like lactoylglutathione lyase family enzyme